MGLNRNSSIMLLFVLSLLSFSVSAFSGEFEITGLEVDSPFQADPTSTSNSTVSCELFAVAQSTP
jgi:hypothetical protein